MQFSSQDYNNIIIHNRRAFVILAGGNKNIFFQIRPLISSPMVQCPFWTSSDGSVTAYTLLAQRRQSLAPDTCTKDSRNLSTVYVSLAIYRWPRTTAPSASTVISTSARPWSITFRYRVFILITYLPLWKQVRVRLNNVPRYFSSKTAVDYVWATFGIIWDTLYSDFWSHCLGRQYSQRTSCWSPTWSNWFFLKWAISGLFFFIFVFSVQLNG